jgi:hypothetical protein
MSYKLRVVVAVAEASEQASKSVLSEKKMFQTKVAEENETHIFCHFFLYNRLHGADFFLRS